MDRMFCIRQVPRLSGFQVGAGLGLREGGVGAHFLGFDFAERLWVRKDFRFEVCD